MAGVAQLGVFEPSAWSLWSLSCSFTGDKTRLAVGVVKFSAGVATLLELEVARLPVCSFAIGVPSLLYVLGWDGMAYVEPFLCFTRFVGRATHRSVKRVVASMYVHTAATAFTNTEKMVKTGIDGAASSKALLLTRKAALVVLVPLALSLLG